VDVARFDERESYSLAESRAALRWARHRLASIARADMLLCTFPTVLCVLLHEIFPHMPVLFVAIANPLFAAPGCAKREDNTVRDCETKEASEYLAALRAMLLDESGLVRGVAAYTVTAALVGYQTGVSLPVAGKAGRYLPAAATWRMQREADVLVARSRFLETAFGANFQGLARELLASHSIPLQLVLQQDLSGYVSYEDLSTFRAVVIFPQDLGLHKFTEHYAMAMPIWMPSRELAYRLQSLVPWGMVSYSGSWRGATSPSEEQQRLPPGHPARLRPPEETWPDPGSPELAHRPFFNAQTVPFPLAKVAFWYEFGEFVAYPAVQTFTSVPEMILGLATADLGAASTSMRRFRAELWRTTRAVYAAAAGEVAEATAKLAVEEAALASE